MPICVSKTQYRLSDNHSEDTIKVTDIIVYNGAKFITVYLGGMVSMPGLPEKPNYEKIKMVNEEFIGLE